ncbi:MAG: hypothetical protein ACFFAE_10655 [Candidatus Hodarchaeota archaeon]
MTEKIVDKRSKIAPSIIRGLIIIVLLYIIIMVILTFIIDANVLKK